MQEGLHLALKIILITTGSGNPRSGGQETGHRRTDRPDDEARRRLHHGHLHHGHGGLPHRSVHGSSPDPVLRAFLFNPPHTMLDWSQAAWLSIFLNRKISSIAPS